MINNGYPENIIDAVTKRKIIQFFKPIPSGPKKCPVYLHLPWLGNVSTTFETQIKTAVKRCYFAVEPRIVFTTRQLLPATTKMYCLLLTKAILFTNTCATAIVGTWAVLPKDCSRESRSMCRNLFEVCTLFKIEPHWPVPVNQSNPSTPKFLHQRLDNISYTTNYAHKTSQMINFPYLHMAAQLSIF